MSKESNLFIINIFSFLLVILAWKLFKNICWGYQNGILKGRFEAPGGNHRMTDIQGAMGLAQVQKLDAIVLARV